MAEANLKFCVVIDSIPSHQHKLYTYILFATLLIFFNNYPFLNCPAKLGEENI